MLHLSYLMNDNIVVMSLSLIYGAKKMKHQRGRPRSLLRRRCSGIVRALAVILSSQNAGFKVEN